ncbi:isochorismatase family protein [Nocardia takedensis]|uniref:isochorismatase family protein n=1 Tax=Nocardia takedensis TaxID=259390 RepID=UPI0006843057|nr:isochorismatase family protein [Nocardia takedensis]
MRFGDIPDRISYDMPVGIPDNAADWTVRPERAYLLVHDMQRYFLRPLDSAAAPGAQLVSNIRALRAACAERGIPVGYTAQPGGMDRLQRGLLRDFWGDGMTTDESDREIVPELAPAPGDDVYTKWRYSAFHRSVLAERMARLGRDQLVVCGVYAHVGVLMTACDAFTRDIQPFLVADAVADFTAEDHRMTLDYAARRCAYVQSTADLLADLDAGEALSAAGRDTDRGRG